MVLFDPLPINAHGSSQLIAAAENTVLLGLILASLRQLRIVVRASFARPYVLLCLVYSLGFMYAFAALGNLGLIERERTMLLPFLLVLLCIPRGPKRALPATSGNCDARTPAAPPADLRTDRRPAAGPDARPRCHAVRVSPVRGPAPFEVDSSRRAASRCQVRHPHRRRRPRVRAHARRGWHVRGAVGAGPATPRSPHRW